MIIATDSSKRTFRIIGEICFGTFLNSMVVVTFPKTWLVFKRPKKKVK